MEKIDILVPNSYKYMYIYSFGLDSLRFIYHELSMTIINFCIILIYWQKETRSTITNRHATSLKNYTEKKTMQNCVELQQWQKFEILWYHGWQNYAVIIPFYYKSPVSLLKYTAKSLR